MLYWVASYPRSGNTLFMTALREGWGLRTRTVYGRGRQPKQAEQAVNDLICEARADSGPVFLKTHDPEHAGEPDAAVYIVRDGRDSVVSYSHLMKATSGSGETRSHEQRMLALARQREFAGSWSGNVEAWLDRAAPTVVVRFEDLRLDPLGEARRALSALGADPGAPGGRVPGLEEIQALSKKRRGVTGDWRREMSPTALRVFEQAHGETLERLGYPLAIGERIHEGEAEGVRVLLIGNFQLRALAHHMAPAIANPTHSLEFIAAGAATAGPDARRRALARVSAADHLVISAAAEEQAPQGLTGAEIAAAMRGGASLTRIPYVANSGVCGLSELRGATAGAGRILGDRYVRELLAGGAEVDDVVAAYGAGELDLRVRARFDRGVEMMAARQQATAADLPLAELIGNEQASRRLLLSYNHPSAALLTEIARMLGDRTDLDLDLGALSSVKATDPAGIEPISAPLSPYDVEALGCAYEPDADWRGAGATLIERIAAQRAVEPAVDGASGP